MRWVDSSWRTIPICLRRILNELLTVHCRYATWSTSRCPSGSPSLRSRTQDSQTMKNTRSYESSPTLVWLCRNGTVNAMTQDTSKDSNTSSATSMNKDLSDIFSSLTTCLNSFEEAVSSMVQVVDQLAEALSALRSELQTLTQLLMTSCSNDSSHQDVRNLQTLTSTLKIPVDRRSKIISSKSTVKPTLHRWGCTAISGRRW